MDEFVIIPREDWGARFHDGFHYRKVGNLEKWLHHSVTLAPDLVPPFTDDYAAIRELDQIGEERFKGGISYTFAITPAGLIFEGHSIDRVGSHTHGHNTVGAGIVFVGNYSQSAPPTRMLQALTWLLHRGVQMGWWKSPTLNGGHRDTKSTQCPGDKAYALIDEINRGDFKVASNEGAAAPAVDIDMEDSMLLIRQGEAGPGHGRVVFISGGRVIGVTPYEYGALQGAMKQVNVSRVFFERIIKDQDVVL